MYLIDLNNMRNYDKNLEKLGTKLSKIQFDFKIKNKSSEEYWTKRIHQFKTYHKTTIEYFTQAYSVIKLKDEDKSGLFLLKLSKLKQLGKELLDNMEKIKQNPSVMNLKDSQQSKWSIKLRENLIQSNENCLKHEKHMNVFFRGFFENTS